jgi:amino-acid N-acetyltransferase
MKPTDLRGILQYIPQFREKTFILAVDGAIVTDENFATLLLDVAVLRSLNIRVVLVHGASAQIRALADEQKITPSDLDGSGITDAATLKLALHAANRLTHEILEGLSANDLRAASTNVITAHPMGIIQGVDHLFTGKVERVDTELLQSLLAQGVVPVIPPLGFDGDGKTYRVNSDGVAAHPPDAGRRS